jgi:hypothetical protein
MSQDAVKIRALAVDDHPLLREGIAALIADETDIALVGEAAKRSNSSAGAARLSAPGSGSDPDRTAGSGPDGPSASHRWSWWSRLWRMTGRVVGDRTQAVTFGS